ncbi:23S rRNA (adenine(2030)-N(6))-methyltransferase RlmJ [Litoreibacter sp.]|nr:23S rRNA (adenine(2030)-N(6))-methyltransferase RlmJ [Litoreibacter sp.]
MLSYQHIYHAGNPADVHKHALLASMLSYLIRKDKPLSYLETHAGRGLYQLDTDAALKTGEAASGVQQLQDRFAPDHPYLKALSAIRAVHGPAAYPGSPLLASTLLRKGDRLHVAELHPQEHAALAEVMRHKAKCYPIDGFEMAHAVAPPEPRRGLLLIDPSYEIKTDYETIPVQIAKLHRKWNVGVIALWYPLLTSGAHGPMLRALDAQNLPGSFRHEVTFPPVREGHRMIGSGMFVINAPYGITKEGETLSHLFAKSPASGRRK